MNIDDYISSGGFIKVETVMDAGGTIRDVITDVRPGSFDRPDMELQGGGVLGLNNTNSRTLKQAWGPNTDAWIGKEVELYIGKTTYKGSQQDSVMVRAISPHTEWRSRFGEPAGSKPRRKELDDEIPF